MFCFRCGQELPPKGTVCPVCDAPQKRRLRRRQRLFVGLLIFLAGALVGSLVDTLFFQGHSWDNIFQLTLSKKPVASFSHKITKNSLQHEETKTIPPNHGIPTLTWVPDVPLKPIPASLQESLAPIPKKEMIVSTESVLLASTGDPVEPPMVSSISIETPPVEEVATFAHSPKNYELFHDGKTTTLEDTGGVSFHGSFSPDGKFLIFSSIRPTESGSEKLQCFIREVSSTTPSTRAFPWRGNVWTPEFSTDGNFLVFSSDSEPQEHIFVYDRKTRQSRQLTKGNSKNMMPSISPNGNFIAFTSNRKGNNDIWIVSVDGKELIQVTSGKEDEREPRWWHDGKSILFTRIEEKLKKSHLMQVSLNPIEPPKKLIADDRRNWMGDPSPDGAYLAYVKSEKDEGSGNVIKIKNLETGSEFTINPFKGGEHFRPIWVNQGEGIVFHADRNKRKSLYLAEFKRKPLN